jgi:hypothetical protein
MTVRINLDKARVIAHVHRRVRREEEFAPLDAVIAKQIPGKSSQDAEAARQVVRDRYAALQRAIDDASDVETLAQIYHSI